MAQKRFFSDFVNGADQIDIAADRLGVSAEKLQIWGEAAKRAGGSAEGLQGSLRSLQSHMTQFRSTGMSGAVMPLARMGIDPGILARSDSFDAMRALAGRMQGMSARRANRVGAALGIDAGTVALLRQGTKALDEHLARAKQLGVYSKDDAEMARKWRNAMYDLQQVFKSIAAIVARVFVPPLTLIVKLFTDGAAKAREYKGAILAIFTGLAAKFAPITTAVGAAALVFEDFWVWAHDGKSALEDLWNTFGTGKEVLDKIRNTASDLFNAWKTRVSNLLESLSPLNKAVQPLLDVLGSLFGLVGDITGLLWDFIGLFTDKGPEQQTSLLYKAMKGLADILSKVFEMLGFVFEVFKDVIGAARGFVKWLGSLDLSRLLDPSQWSGLWTDAVAGLKEKLSGLWSSFTENFPDISGRLASWGDAIKSWWNGIIDFFVEKWNAAIDKLLGCLPDWLKKYLGADEETRKAKADEAAARAKDEEDEKKAIEQIKAQAETSKKDLKETGRASFSYGNSVGRTSVSMVGGSAETIDAKAEEAIAFAKEETKRKAAEREKERWRQSFSKEDFENEVNKRIIINAADTFGWQQIGESYGAMKKRVRQETLDEWRKKGIVIPGLIDDSLANASANMGGLPPVGSTSPAASVAPSAVTNNVQADNSSQVTINGGITVQTAATDANGIAAGISGALRNQSFTGVNPHKDMAIAVNSGVRQ